MPMRFLILTQYYPPEVGAPQVRLSAFARALMKRGHEVEVVTALPNYPEGRILDGYRRRAATTEEIDGVRVRRVWLHAATGSGIGRVLNYATFSATSLPGLASMPRPGVVFVESPPPTLAVTGWLMARRWGVPMVLNISDLWPDSALQLGLLREGATARAMRRLESWAYRHADFITAVTEGIRTTLISEKGVLPAKILFLPNGVDVDVFRPMPPDKRLASELGLADRTVVLTAGTIGYAHGLEVALDAAELLRDSPITFLIVGGGSERNRLKRLADQRQLSNVVFLDARPSNEIPPLYSIASIGLSTLRDSPLFEGTRPVRMLAAMACGKPVVYSGAGEGARMLLAAEAGVVVPPADPIRLAAAITDMLDQPDTASEMGRRGREFIEATLSWDAIVGAWLDGLSARLSSQSVLS
jgi:glycosyltransferase involved in cell wall biosynthesis